MFDKQRAAPPPLYRIATTALLSPSNILKNKKEFLMVLAFTEEQAIEIRKTGLSVIQFKHCIKNGISTVEYYLRQCIANFKSAFDNMCECFREAMDNIRYIFDTVKNCLGYPTSRRYRFVKILGNFGYRKYDTWVATRTYRARSNC